MFGAASLQHWTVNWTQRRSLGDRIAEGRKVSKISTRVPDPLGTGILISRENEFLSNSYPLKQNAI